MNKKLFAALALSLPVSASADVLGLTAGLYNWTQNFSGDLRSEQTGSDKIDLEDDLNFDDDSANVYFVAFEHPIPVLPNIRVGSTGMEIKETGTVNRTFNYEGTTYNQGREVQSDIDLSHIDATLYYEILDNFVSLDVGLTARKFDGEATIAYTDGTQSETADIDGTLPLLYANARVELPFLPGLYASGELHGISYSGNSLIDTKLGLGYEILGIVGLELGLRSFELDLEGDDDEEFNMTIDGAFVGVVVDL